LSRKFWESKKLNIYVFLDFFNVQILKGSAVSLMLNGSPEDVRKISNIGFFYFLFNESIVPEAEFETGPDHVDRPLKPSRKPVFSKTAVCLSVRSLFMHNSRKSYPIASNLLGNPLFI